MTNKMTNCPHCGESIQSGGNPTMMVPIPHIADPETYYMNYYHYECHIRMVVGGLNHLRGTCVCCGGEDPPDPPEMTRRQAALAAFEHWKHLEVLE